MSFLRFSIQSLCHVSEFEHAPTQYFKKDIAQTFSNCFKKLRNVKVHFG